MMTSTTLLLFVGATAFSCLHADGDDMRPSIGQRRQVSITLLGPAKDLAGIDVPPGLAQQRSEYLRSNEPSDVTLKLPDGSEMRLPVKYVSVIAQYGTITDVNLLPLEKTVPFKEAVDELHRLFKELKIEPDERMKEKMKRDWPEDAPGFDPVNRPGFYPHSYRAGTSISEDIAFDIKLRPADDGGWFLVLTFAIQGPKRQAVRDRLDVPPSTSQPVTSPAGTGG